MKHQNRIPMSVRPITIIVLLFILITAPEVKGEIVWSETFDQGYDNWDVSHGTVEVQNGVLTTTTCEKAYILTVQSGNQKQTCFAVLMLNSTGMTGTWSFDYFSDIVSSNLYMTYSSEGIDPSCYPDSLTTTFCSAQPMSGYGLNILGSEYRAISTSMFFGYFISDNCSCGVSSMPGVEYAVPDGWKHIDITRDSSGVADLYLDYEHVSQFNEISPATNHSEHVAFLMSLGDKLDNVTYNSQVVDITPTATMVSSSNPPKSNNSSMIFFGIGMIGTSTFALVNLKKKDN